MAVVRPVATYGCHVWWPVIAHRIHVNTLSRLNRVALLSLTGAMKTTPTAAMEIILNINPLDIHVKEMAKITLNRLQQTGSLKTQIVRHSSLITDIEGDCPTDYITPYNMTDEKIEVFFPSIDDWLQGKVKFSELNIFTDGSKMSVGTGCGFYCPELQLESSYRLRTDCSIFQAEVYAIAMAARQISMMPIYRSNISIFIDSQAAIMALTTDNIRSKVLSSCHKELAVLREQHNVTICWVPGHKNILGNERADELARRGAILPQEEAELGIFPPLSLVFQRIRLEYRLEWISRWNVSDSCLQTKYLWDETKDKYSKILLEMDRRKLRMVMNMITGHNTLGKHMVRLRITNDDTCRWCREAVEDSYHFLCECPVLSKRRFDIFGSYFFQSLMEIRGLNPWTLWEYIRKSKWDA